MSGWGKNMCEANKSKGKIKTGYRIYLFLGSIDCAFHCGHPWPPLLLTLELILELLPCSGPTYLHRWEAPLTTSFSMDFKPWKDSEILISPNPRPTSFPSQGIDSENLQLLQTRYPSSIPKARLDPMAWQSVTGSPVYFPKTMQISSTSMSQFFVSNAG